MNERKRRSVTITLTEACNLDCTYCYENHKSQKRISMDTVKEIILKEMTEDNGFTEVEFDLFGGEPFLEFELIKEIEEYFHHIVSDKHYVIFASTNGTLVHGEIKKWLLNHLDVFVCGLSYDGTNQMQNINRSNSASHIDLDFFAKYYPTQEVKMTISPESLPSLSDGVIFLHEKGFRVSCNLAYNIDWSDESNKEILHNELMKLIDYYISHPEIVPCRMLDQDIRNVGALYGKNQYIRYCGAKIGTVAYHLDGTQYPCQFFMPLSVGEEKAKEALSLKFYNESIPQELIEEKCLKCVAHPICPTCFGANFAATGDMYRHDDNYCELTKIIIRARSYFKAMQWQKGQLKLDDNELVHLLNSIKIIQSEL
ncbi:putative uncharacterized protein [Ruminococcus sp. CAG:624]|nr:putative uncharacterized protein [Ruminococcus sp. CAG:624]